MSLAFDVCAPRVKPTTVRAVDLPSALTAFADVRVLSLDCFDTLLWRSTAAPVDVFYDLARRPAFARIGMNAKLRVVAETKARELKFARTGQREVTLPEIYRAAFPDLDDAAVMELANDEVEAEIEACCPLPQTVALIRHAKAKGLRVVIVSDTYLVEAELRRLLEATIPADAYAAIERVFCSVVYGRSKGEGLFKPALDALGVRARDVLHVGDNPEADLRAATAIGANALHLVHHEAEIDALLRMQTTAASLLMPAVREQASLPSPFRALLASAPASAKPDAVFSLGYASLGPILFAFARWLAGELADLRASGANVKPIFLMRDGFMLERACRALMGEAVGPLVSLSRFAAFAASFRTSADVERYLAGWAGSRRFADLGRQMLLTEDETRAIIAKTRKAERQEESFTREVLRPKTVSAILERSSKYRARLVRHLETTGGITSGDTVVFVDLGYEGTAQRQLEPVLREAMGVEVVGRYVIAARVPGWERSRRGLLDPSWCDDRLIATLVPYVALLENLCASDCGSTVDYADDGSPIRAASLVKPEQAARVAPVQRACEDFIHDAVATFAEMGKEPSVASLRPAAVTALARMLLLSSRSELDYLASFALDMNLGADDNIPLFDAEMGLAGLRNRGLFFIGSNAKSEARIAGPVELRAASLELALTLVAQHRFGLEMTPADMTLRREPIGILSLRGATSAKGVAEARATHDGYFALHVPMDATDSALGVLFGERWSWVQIESVTRIEATALYRSNETERSEDMSAFVHLEGMAVRDAPGGLFECTSKEGFLLVAAPPPRVSDRRYVCRIVFRPVSARRDP